MLTLKLLADRPEYAGTFLESGCPFTTVTLVNADSGPADIEVRRYTKDWSKRTDKPYVLTSSNRKFATIKAAVAAYKKERSIG